MLSCQSETLVVSLGPPQDLLLRHMLCGFEFFHGLDAIVVVFDRIVRLTLHFHHDLIDVQSLSCWAIFRGKLLMILLLACIVRQYFLLLVLALELIDSSQFALGLHIDNIAITA